MDRALNSRLEKETIYEIYRGCRLCGAGAGYKMPIVQNVVDLEDSGPELRQKIRETVQIEVHQDDKMPPLICELCVDKVNDFYEFLDMCRRTNKQTRMKLGLSMQMAPGVTKNKSESNNCILGNTEPIYINDDSDGEPLLKEKSKTKEKVKDKSSKVKKEPEVRIRIENYHPRDTKPTRACTIKRAPSPMRVTRLRHSAQNSSDVSLSKLQEQIKKSVAGPKSMKKEKNKETNVIKIEDASCLLTRLKRPREKDSNVEKVEIPTKKAKLAVETPKPSPKLSPKSSPKVVKPPQKTAAKPPAKRPDSPARPAKRPTSPARSTKRTVSPARSAKMPVTPVEQQHTCFICYNSFRNSKAYNSHVRVHTVTFTNSKLACNACGEWFSNNDEVTTHHRRHKYKAIPYHCRRCTANFQQQQAFEGHFGNNQCIPFDEVPDVRCEECWRCFATDNLLIEHKCLGEDGRPGGKCKKCNRTYVLMKNLIKHESTCMHKMKSDLTADPELLARLKPMQVRVARCDPLLANIKEEHYDVSSVDDDFGLDKNYVYPYISSVRSIKIKTEPYIDEYDSMVKIKQEIKDEFCSEENFVHWDSDSSENDEEINNFVVNPFANKKKVDTLTTLSLKTLFSQKLLGKVPKKRRKVKTEASPFDSLLNDSGFDMTKDIDNIIDNLDRDADTSINVCGNDENAFGSRRVNKELQKVGDEGKIDKRDNNHILSVRIGDHHKKDDVSDTDSYSLLDDPHNDRENNCNLDSKNVHNDDLSHDNEKLNNNSSGDIIKYTDDVNHVINKNISTNKNDDFDNIKHSNGEISKIRAEDTNNSNSFDVPMETDQDQIDKSIEDTEDLSSNKLLETESQKDATSILNESMHTENSLEKEQISNHGKRELFEECEIDGYTRRKETENVETSQKLATRNDRSVNLNNADNDKELHNEDTANVCQSTEVSGPKKDKANHVIEINSQKKDFIIINNETETTIINDFTISAVSDTIRNNDLTEEKSEITEMLIENKDESGSVSVDKSVSNVNGVSKLKCDDLDCISDTEMDDKKLMDALNDQIGEPDHRTTNNGVFNEADVSEQNKEENILKCDLKLNKNNDLSELNINKNDGNIVESEKNEKLCYDSATQKDDYYDRSNDSITNETNYSSTQISERKNEKEDKISLEDLLASRDNDLKSMDLDSISDEDFNFDV